MKTLAELFPREDMPMQNWQADAMDHMPNPSVITTKWQRPLDDLGGGDFIGAWYPTAGADDEEVIVTGGSIFDGTTLHLVDGDTLAIHATSLNYIYLECDLSPDTIDSYISGGTVDATPVIATNTTLPTNTNTKGYILLFTWQAGELVDRYAYFNFGCELLNNSSGVGDVTFNWWSI